MYIAQQLGAKVPISWESSCGMTCGGAAHVGLGAYERKVMQHLAVAPCSDCGPLVLVGEG